MLIVDAATAGAEAVTAAKKLLVPKLVCDGAAKLDGPCIVGSSTATVTFVTPSDVLKFALRLMWPGGAAPPPQVNPYMPSTQIEPPSANCTSRSPCSKYKGGASRLGSKSQTSSLLVS